MVGGLLAFAIALIASLILTVPVRALALRVGMVDLPGPRKVHLTPIPLLGGLAIYGGIVLAIVLALDGPARAEHGHSRRRNASRSGRHPGRPRFAPSPDQTLCRDACGGRYSSRQRNSRAGVRRIARRADRLASGCGADPFLGRGDHGGFQHSGSYGWLVRRRGGTGCHLLCRAGRSERPSARNHFGGSRPWRGHRFPPVEFHARKNLPGRWRSDAAWLSDGHTGVEIAARARKPRCGMARAGADTRCTRV